MKVAYSHLVRNIKENPSMEMLSESLFQLGHEHEIEGEIFDIEITPNRGDCLSINGLLRDLSAFYNVNLKQEIFGGEIKELKIDFENLAQDICPKISFLKIEIEKIPKKYKPYLNDYFEDLDLNKNNFFTDISNYLSYETGQPTHCYDANKIDGKLYFKEIGDNQAFETLLGNQINLTNKNSVFLLDNNVINLAGVIGGKGTSCKSDTKTVLVECAFFKPEAIIGKSVKYDIYSEASHKFERFVDPECHEEVLRRFINIVTEHTNIKNMSLISYEYRKNEVIKIPMHVNKINEILGINITEREYLEYLSKLGFNLSENLIIVPSYRNDIKSQNDLAEEIARIIGYDNIKKNKLSIPKTNYIDDKNLENKLRFFLLDNGFFEVINSPFVKNKSNNSIKVDNPLDSNKKYLRTNLTDSLIENLIFNERRQKDSIKLFEISNLYTSKNGEIISTRRLGIIASGRVGHNHEDFSKQINRKYLTKLFKDFLPHEDFKFEVLNRDLFNTKIKNEIVKSEVDIANFSTKVLDYEEVTKPPVGFIKYAPISELPHSIRDLSFSVKDFSKLNQLNDYILKFDDEFLKEVFVFDYFHNEKNKEIKIGFRFIFQATSSTITETQVNNIINDIIFHSTNISGVTIPGLNKN